MLIFFLKQSAKEKEKTLPSFPQLSEVEYVMYIFERHYFQG